MWCIFFYQNWGPNKALIAHTPLVASELYFFAKKILTWKLKPIKINETTLCALCRLDLHGYVRFDPEEDVRNGFQTED